MMIVGALLFGVAFYAFCATLYLIDANANVQRLEAELVRSGKVAEHLRAVAAKANLDCYQRHSELYGDKSNA